MASDRKRNPLNLSAEHYSSNWKLLQEKLKQELAEKASKPSTSNAKAKPKKKKKPKPEIKKQRTESELTKALSLDCEYVGAGVEGKDDLLARVSIVNEMGECVYNKYVLPTDKVTDLRTEVSGIRGPHLKCGEPFSTVQQEVNELLSGKILVGHAVHNDLKVLHLAHPKRLTRDTARYKLFREMIPGKGTPALRKLAHHILGVQIQTSEHDSIQDARIAMNLYKMHRKQWEKSKKLKK